MKLLVSRITDIDSPRIQKFSFEDNIVDGKVISVTCFAITKTKPVSFEWLKNGRRITAQEDNVRINTANEASLLILDPVTMDDGGNYTCSATNAHGTDKYTAVLEVKGIYWFF